MKKIISILFILWVTSVTGQISSRGMFHNTKTFTVSYDTDAQAYFTALAGDVTVTDAQKGYINTFVLALKSYGIWPKISAMYFPIWNNASADKWNLKDVRDLDAAYRLSFSGSISRSTSGMTGDGSSGYANTHLQPDALGTNDISLSFFYSRTNNTNVGKDMGAVFNVYCEIWLYVGGVSIVAINNSSQTVTASISNTSGFFTSSRTTSALVTAYQNGSSYGTNTEAPGGHDSYNIYLLARNNAGTADGFTNRQHALDVISQGLSSTEAANFYTAVQALMTSFGINV